jgi:uncharacterized SAM-binding protein YcdF (DUF218 family)
MTRSGRPTRSRASGNFLRRVIGLVLLAGLCWFGWVYLQIDMVAREDHAQAADAIAVFGAAEYSGHPSPVLHARLDHAVALYKRQIAPLVITLGGGGDKDSGTTEGGVGRDYLLANGVPYDKIIAETRSVDTEQQVQRLAAIAQADGLGKIVVVSDGTHLFRIRELCRAAGLDVYTSPRPSVGHISSYDLFQRYMHEILSYTSLRLNLHASWLHRWLENKDEL